MGGNGGVAERNRVRVWLVVVGGGGMATWQMRGWVGLGKRERDKEGGRTEHAE